MAGDWLKIEHALPDKPEVVQMAGLVNVDQDAIAGKLLRLWIWADQQTVDGNALTVTEVFIDRITFCPGFATALRTVGWLTGDDGQLEIPNFHRHNGQTAKKRANTSKRVKASRSRNADSNAPTVTPALPEKRREESLSGITIPPNLDRPDVIAAVAEWKSHVSTNHNKLIPDDSPQEQALWSTLNRFGGPDIVIEQIELSMSSDWANVKKPESPGDQPHGKSKSGNGRGTSFNKERQQLAEMLSEIDCESQ